MILAGVLGGLIAGSFIAALTSRWPAGDRITRGRSRCDSCSIVLGPLDLIPVLSFIVRRGSCGTCGAVIPVRNLWIELAGAGIGGVAFVLQPDMGGAAGAAFGWALLALAVLDGEHMWLPDQITVPLLAAGLLAGVWLDPPLSARLLGAGAGYASLTAIAVGYKLASGRTGMGGGDPKLFAAIGAWLGWQALPFVLVLAAGGGLTMVGHAALRGQRVERQTPLPLGSLLAAAAFAFWCCNSP